MYKSRFKVLHAWRKLNVRYRNILTTFGKLIPILKLCIILDMSHKMGHNTHEPYV